MSDNRLRKKEMEGTHLPLTNDNSAAMKQVSGSRPALEVAVHLIVWGYVFVSPLFFRHAGEDIDWVGYARRLWFPALSCLVFYVNYLVLVPHLLLKHRPGRFVVWNVLLIAVVMFGHDFYMQLLPPGHHPSRTWGAAARGLGRHFHRPGGWFLFFFLRGVFGQLMMVAAAVGVRLSLSWRQAEAARREAEAARGEAELQNLKNQINPHFLLNTLNNIYALTEFAPEQARGAIEQLSGMLRYMLYENDTPRVPLQKEIDFIGSYIALMRIRLSERVDIRFTVDAPQAAQTLVAPLIFISLVENAFKHGVSSTQPSFLHISLTQRADAVCFRCENSNYPKSHRDHQPGGIGLAQVQRRLNYAYPATHSWTHGPSSDGKVYVAEVIIQRL